MGTLTNRPETDTAPTMDPPGKGADPLRESIRAKLLNDIPFAEQERMQSQGLLTKGGPGGGSPGLLGPDANAFKLKTDDPAKKLVALKLKHKTEYWSKLDAATGKTKDGFYQKLELAMSLKMGGFKLSPSVYVKGNKNPYDQGYDLKGVGFGLRGEGKINKQMNGFIELGGGASIDQGKTKPDGLVNVGVTYNLGGGKDKNKAQPDPKYAAGYVPEPSLDKKAAPAPTPAPQTPSAAAPDEAMLEKLIKLIEDGAWQAASDLLDSMP
jgi:hypothetical protein